MEKTPFETVQGNEETLAEKVAGQITQLIIERQLTSNDKLPNEFELAEQLNVGRGSIREAVKLLVSRHVLEIRRGKGTYITENPGMVDDPLGFAFYPDQLQLALDLLEIRTQMEPWVAALAAKRGTPEEIAFVEQKCAEVEDEILAGRNHLEKDKEFHTSIAQCVHNLVLPRLIPLISYSVGLFGELSGNTLLSGTIVGHRAILNAIKAGDSEAAADAMKEHMKMNREALEALKAEKEKESGEEE